MAPVIKRCDECASEDIWVNARAEWSVEEQGYVLIDSYEDEAYCRQCEQSTTLTEEEPL